MFAPLWFQQPFAFAQSPVRRHTAGRLTWSVAVLRSHRPKASHVSNFSGSVLSRFAVPIPPPGTGPARRVGSLVLGTNQGFAKPGLVDKDDVPPAATRGLDSELCAHV
jgi:hypothetical protein